MANPTRWVYDSAHSAAGSSSALAVTSGTVTPQVGDLLIVAAFNFVTTHATTCVLSDTGSNTGWNTIRSTFGATGTAVSAAFWRFATAADHAASPFTVTATFNGSGGTNTSRIVVEVHRVPGFTMLGLDSSQVATSASSVNTLLTAQTGPAPNVDGDLLAWSMLSMSLSNGGVTQVDYLGANRPTTVLMTATGLGTPLLLATANSDSSSGTANIVSDSTEEWQFNWTTARSNACIIGATFKYQHTAGLLPILQRT